MYNTAISYVQNVEDAEEVVQDVFMSIYTKAHTFKGTAKVSTWIYRITVNKALNCINKRNRNPGKEVELQSTHRIDFEHPGVLLENKEKSKYLFAAIETLDENQKTAFILSFIEDLPRQEVADIMKTSLKSIEGLLQRAKTNMRKKLIGMYPKEF